jgi:antitoxin ParD1/3/4
MPSQEKRTFSISTSQAEYIDARVKSGAYASASEVVRAGLRALEERDAAMERWLREEVVPVYDAYHADPSRVIRAEQVFAEIRAHHDAAQKKGKRRSA